MVRSTFDIPATQGFSSYFESKHKTFDMLIFFVCSELQLVRNPCLSIVVFILVSALQLL